MIVFPNIHRTILITRMGINHSNFVLTVIDILHNVPQLIIIVAGGASMIRVRHEDF